MAAPVIFGLVPIYSPMEIPSQQRRPSPVEIFTQPKDTLLVFTTHEKSQDEL